MSDNNSTSSNNNVSFGVIPDGGIALKPAYGLKAPFSVYVTSTSGTREIAVSSDGVGFVVPENSAESETTLTVGIDYNVRTIRITGNPGDKFGTL